VFPATQEVGWWWSEASPRQKKKRLNLPGKKEKTKEKEKAGGMAQVIEHLPSQHKALSSNPSILKKKKSLETSSGK
jgi:hypothetical protein